MTDSAELILKLVDEHRILDEAAGLNEPSGLTLNADGTALYTVSDDTKRSSNLIQRSHEHQRFLFRWC